MTTPGADWRHIDGVTTAWFDTATLTGGAALARRVLEIAPESAVDLRATGVRIRVASEDDAAAVSAAAQELSSPADPSALQQVSVLVESGDASAVRGFWRTVLGYEAAPDGGLVDPLRRDLPMRLRSSAEHRPLRHRIHLDVVRPAAVVGAAGLGDGSGPYGVRHADPDGNEVDLVPGDGLGDADAVADWQAVFAAIACYRSSSPAQQLELATAAAALADDAGFPLLIDLRPGLVILDSGKDQWEADAHGLDVDVTDLAGRIQAAAHALGATADASLARFTQVFFDAADVAAVRAFWTAALGYVTDRRAGVSDIHDPRRLNPVLVFQELDASDTARRQQRNRIHVELAVPRDHAPARVETAVGAGGRVLDESEGRWRIADPEGNELVIVA